MEDAVVLRRLQEICCGTSCKLIPLERPSAMPSACVQSRVCGGSLSDERGQGRGSRVCRGHRKVRLIFRSTQQYHCPVYVVGISSLRGEGCEFIEKCHL